MSKVSKWLSVVIISALLLISCQPSQGWKQLSPENSPPPSGQGAVVFIDSSNTAVLFGGITVEKWLNETWIWNEETWYQVSPVHVPPARAKLAMEYDKARDRVVLFGGEMDKTLFDDTWEWDGKDWHLIDPAHKPPARCCHAMAYDAANENVIMYGGYDPVSNKFLSDIWNWDGEDWTEIHTDMPEMSGHSMVSFPANNTILSIQTAGYGTWSWNGKAWERIEGENPPHRSEGKTAYDNNHHWVVFFGGVANTEMLNDTWVFDNQRWLQLTLPNSPPARFGHVLFYDPTRDSIIIFGGIGDNNTRFGDTWELKLPNISLESLSQSMSYNGDWKGKTSQGLEIIFTVARNEITAMKFAAEWKGPNCSKTIESKMESTIDPTAEATGNFTPIHPIENNAFTISDNNLNTGDTTYTFTGKFSSSTKASGTIEYRVTKGNCQGTNTFNWSATKVSQ